MFAEVQKHALLSLKNARDFWWMAGTNCPVRINCIPVVYSTPNSVAARIEEVTMDWREIMVEALFEAVAFKASHKSVYCHLRRKEDGSLRERTLVLTFQ